MIKDENQTQLRSAPQPTPTESESTLPIVSMVLGVVSLTGPGLLLGIPAIITASIALKRKLGNKGLSITGLVTGIVSTVISFLFLLFMVFLMVWGINYPEGSNNYPHYKHPQQSEQMFDSSRT